jgi:hypothetical protein
MGVPGNSAVLKAALSAASVIADQLFDRCPGDRREKKTRFASELAELQIEQ